MIKKIKRKFRDEANKIVKRIGFDLYKQQILPLNDEIECWFETSDGRSLPVYKNHRYQLKKAWSVFGPIMALEGLNKKGLLDDGALTALKAAKGYRTIGMPLAEVRVVLQPYVERHHDLFINAEIPDLGSRVFMPTQEEVERTISERSERHGKLLYKLSAISGKDFSKKSKVMEIGYTSGGESIIGFERLGLQAIGLDYFYDDNFETGRRHEVVKKLANSKADFIIGDITKKNDLDEESLDLIYTQSVLEHIKDLPAAFNEMYRLLKPGGIMYHRYDPYFHSKGGHPPCMLDSPWAHVRLGDRDIQRYIEELRPNESSATVPWIQNALNRNHNQNFVQNSLVRSGFEIAYWQNIFVSDEQQSWLSPDIVSDCLRHNANVSLEDLLSYVVTFIAIKPKK